MGRDRMHRVVKFARVVAVLLAAGSAMARAASIEVSVLRKPADAPVAGLEVQLGNARTGFAATATTNTQGKARFQSLAPGAGYALRVPASGEWAEMKVDDIDLRTNVDRSLTLQLPPRNSITESVVVQ